MCNFGRDRDKERKDEREVGRKRERQRERDRDKKRNKQGRKVVHRFPALRIIISSFRDFYSKNLSILNINLFLRC